MKTDDRNFLARLDRALRWTGIPARVAEDLSDPESPEHRRRPLRWIPIWLILVATAFFVLAVTWTRALNLALVVASLGGTMIALMPVFYWQGPLGKPWLQDDEREAALRREALLVCLGVLAFLNCIGQPVLMMASHLQNWQTGHVASVAMAGLMLNATVFGCLPTLYASWKLKKLPED